MLKLINDEMLPNACSVDVDVFRERLESDGVQETFARHKKNLKAIYRVYAADDDSDDAILQADTMNCKELTSFASEMGLLGAILNFRMIRTIFAFVQQEEEELEEDEEEDEDGSEMVYSEFVESMGAIACVPAQTPTMSLSQGSKST